MLNSLTSQSGTRDDTGTHGTLVIAYHYLARNESGAGRPRRFVKYLRRRGCLVCVVTSSVATCETLEDTWMTRNVEQYGRSTQRACSVARQVERRLLPYNE